MLTEIVRAMRRSTRYALEMTRARRWRNARTIRERLRRERIALAVKVKGPPREDATAADDALHGEVLRILEDHPEGVRAQDIGNELGIDWRDVAGVMTALVARGLVEQVEHEFYPAAKASRRC